MSSGDGVRGTTGTESVTEGNWVRRQKYTAVEAYKFSVRPLGVFLIVGGVLVGVLVGLSAVVFPADHIFVGQVQSEVAKRTLMVVAALFKERIQPL